MKRWQGRAPLFWETVAAVILILASLPIWTFVALIWGLIRLVLVFVASIFAMTSIEEIWAVPLLAIAAGIEAAWSVPTAIWTWAKFEHPWWAVIIAFVLVSLSGGARR